jgi:hypothetical protein
MIRDDSRNANRMHRRRLSVAHAMSSTAGPPLLWDALSTVGFNVMMCVAGPIAVLLSPYLPSVQMGELVLSLVMVRAARLPAAERALSTHASFRSSFSRPAPSSSRART